MLAALTKVAVVASMVPGVLAGDVYVTDMGTFVAGVGFVGKWYIALGAVRSGTPVVAAVILVSTLLTLAYFARVIERMYFAQPAPGTAGPDVAATDGGESADATVGSDSPVSPAMIAVVVLAAVAAVALGFAGTAVEATLEPTLSEVFAP